MVREVRDAVPDVATWDVLLGCCGEDSAEDLLAGATGGRKFLPRESLLHLTAERSPISLPEISECTVRRFWEVH